MIKVTFLVTTHDKKTNLPNSQRVATQALRSLSASSPSSLPTDTRVAAMDIGHNWGLTAITWWEKDTIVAKILPLNVYFVFKQLHKLNETLSPITNNYRVWIIILTIGAIHLNLVTSLCNHFLSYIPPNSNTWVYTSWWYLGEWYKKYDKCLKKCCILRILRLHFMQGTLKFGRQYDTVKTRV